MKDAVEKNEGATAVTDAPEGLANPAVKGGQSVSSVKHEANRLATVDKNTFVNSLLERVRRGPITVYQKPNGSIHIVVGESAEAPPKIEEPAFRLKRLKTELRTLRRCFTKQPARVQAEQQHLFLLVEADMRHSIKLAG